MKYLTKGDILNMNVYLLIKTKFARDGGTLDINCNIYKNYNMAYKNIKTDLAKYNSKNIKIVNKNNKFDSAELTNDNYPWTPQITWYLYKKKVIE